MNEELQAKLRAVIKGALDEFADQQINIASENARDAIAFRVATDIVDNFSEVLKRNNKVTLDDHVRSELRKHFIF